MCPKDWLVLCILRTVSWLNIGLYSIMHDAVRILFFCFLWSTCLLLISWHLVTGTGATGESSVPRKLFGFDFWIMVSILAGGGALLLLLICVLIICACRSCNRKKHEQGKRRLYRLKEEKKQKQKGNWSNYEAVNVLVEL